MRQSPYKEKQRILTIFAHFITILTATESPSPTSVSLPSVGITASDLPPISSASPVEAAVVDDTVLSPSPTLECTVTEDKDFKFILSTRMNRTGHWLADIDVQPGMYASRMDMPFEVRLEHHTRMCLQCTGSKLHYAHVSLAEPPPARVPRGRGYRYFPGFGFYKRHLEEKTWQDARDACKDEGADLVVINSQEEAKLLLELSAPLLFLKPAAKWNAEAYVGIHDLHDESEFITVDGLTLNETGYVHWSPGEPNNHREEDCVTIVRNAMYNDVQCTKTFEFICEVPE